jgi:hypothetical protein
MEPSGRVWVGNVQDFAFASIVLFPISCLTLDYSAAILNSLDCGIKVLPPSGFSKLKTAFAAAFLSMSPLLRR